MRVVNRRHRDGYISARLNRLRKKLKVQFGWGDMHLPERSRRHTSNRVEAVDVQNCPSGKGIKGRTHVVGERELKEEGRDV